MKHRASHGFTLIEVLAVIVIILVIAGWIVSAARSAQMKSARTRADGEIKRMSMACESFKTDYGSYPSMPGVTEAELNGDPPLNPQKDGDPNTDAYKASSLFLYVALSGDDNKDGKLTPPDERSKGYMDFLSTPGILNAQKDGNGTIMRVNFLMDPFGNSYGYSTGAAKQEADFKADVAAKGDKAKRPETPVGYNPSFDLWSTGGLVSTSKISEAEQNVWIKNW
jgi:prepilin-type N-terminal cleavage/methylation domain-containing protein